MISRLDSAVTVFIFPVFRRKLLIETYNRLVKKLPPITLAKHEPESTEKWEDIVKYTVPTNPADLALHPNSRNVNHAH